ncbi:MAG: hypothetical protein F6K19_24425 [Cyanothece sp. SIO1E1]|nr:hypothetical protein [Cyanothece sp. SIO1E1]
MISSDPRLSSKPGFIEVVAADLGDFQIVVPTSTQVVRSSFFLTHITTPKREYSREGWMIYRDQIVSSLFELEVGEIALENCPFKPIKRLGPAVPIAFETYGHNPLPSQVTGVASFSCQFKDGALPYCSVFRQLLPRFVRLYSIPQLHQEQILGKVKQLLVEEAQFVAQHREQLKQVPFYREKFNLASS